MKKLGTALIAFTMALSAIAIPGTVSAQQNGPIPYIQDRDRVRQEDRRQEDRRPDFRPDDRRHDDRRPHSRRDEPRRHHEGRRDRDDDITIGILGLAAGAIIGGAIVEDRRYDTPPPPRFRPPVREYRHSFIRPWSPDWYRWCSNRYRSFNPRTGTFIAYDGVRQFCDANR
jgi:hypothetical protein